MKKNRLLYEKQFEHDACGVGFVADINGKRANKILQKALEGVVNLTHRGAVGGDKKTDQNHFKVHQVQHTQCWLKQSHSFKLWHTKNLCQQVVLLEHRL